MPRIARVGIRNYRRLRNVEITLDESTTLFVGANNSGKTSAMEALRGFLEGNVKGFSIYDFNAECWEELEQLIAEAPNFEGLSCPKLDLWFEVEPEWLYRFDSLIVKLPSEVVIDAIELGIRVALSPKPNLDDLPKLKTYLESQADTTSAQWPSIVEYLENKLSSYFELKYFVLQSNGDGQIDEFEFPGSQDSTGKQFLEKCVRLDVLNAQRHLSDQESSRSERLGAVFGRFYDHERERMSADPERATTVKAAEEAIKAARVSFNSHISEVFKDTLEQIRSFGYPGPDNPKISIQSDLDPRSALSKGGKTRVNYNLAKDDEPSRHLPDTHNGLGYKQLIFMLVELFGFRKQWESANGERTPVHLILIEEPECHLHIQMQQVFVRELSEHFGTAQMVITTHSPHILFERSLSPIRYFRRSGGTTQVKDLASFGIEPVSTRNFLQKYLRQTHCDMFFADAIVMVEGPSERLLVPDFIEKAAPALNQCYLSVVEVGGAYVHKFFGLVKFLGTPTLIVTDIDSCQLGDNKVKCVTSEEGAVTSNPALKSWFHEQIAVSDLLTTSRDSCERTYEDGGPLILAYQRLQKLYDVDVCGRTFEQSFLATNSGWPKKKAMNSLSTFQNRFAMEEALLRYAPNKGKTDFAMNIFASSHDWKVPPYIADGLKRLAAILGLGHEAEANVND